MTDIFANGKRWVSLVLAVSLLLGCVPFGALAAEETAEIVEAAVETTEVPAGGYHHPGRLSHEPGLWPLPDGSDVAAHHYRPGHQRHFLCSGGGGRSAEGHRPGSRGFGDRR